MNIHCSEDSENITDRKCLQVKVLTSLNDKSLLIYHEVPANAYGHIPELTSYLPLVILRHNKILGYAVKMM